tara:strand:- start:9494 stop:10111 length:618 start_codon:yes stop_codon:yes gene_type:complete
MSWLSKALKGNTLKIGATIAASYVGREYLFGETGTVMEGGGNPFGYGPQEYTSGNLASSFLNTVGVTPFAQTAIGEVVSPYLQKLGSEQGFFTTGLEPGSLAEQFFGKGFSRDMGMGVNIPGPRSYNSRESYEAGRAQQLALGNGAVVKNALSKPSMQSYLTKQVAGFGIPSPAKPPKGTTITTSTSPTTTASRRRRQRLLTEGT